MKQIIKRMLIITLYMMLILITTNVYAKSAKAKEETVRIRKEASTDSSIVALMSQNEEVEILEETGDWYKVKYSNYTGYVRKDMLELNKENDTNASKEQQNQEEGQQEQNSTEPQNQDVTGEENNNLSSEEQSTENTLQKGYSGKLTAKLDIKILPLINSSVINSIDENTQITITDVINKWCYIQTENSSGWALMSKVKTEEVNKKQEPKPEEQENNENESKEEKKTENENKEDTNKKEEKNTETVKYVSAETLNVREEADNNSKIISQLTLNTKVTVVEKINNTWAKITVKGKTGYVANKYLSDKKVDVSSRSEDLKRENTETKKEEEQKDTSSNVQESAESKQDTTSNQSGTGSTGANVVAFAKKYLGYHYVSGGASPSTGFDCSGFTTYVYKNFGISLSRTSGAQASNGTAVSRANLQAGDLVIFNNSSNSAVGHVGIYIGGNTFIHAANAKKGVITTSLSDSYYSPRFVTGRRVIH